MTNVYDTGSGVEVLNISNPDEFRSVLPEERSSHLQLSVLQRLIQVFAFEPDRVLQELADVAVSLCGADSAGTSLETKNSAGEPVFQWVATSGEYAPFLNSVLPRLAAPCSVCLDRLAPQSVCVPKSYLEQLGVQAQPITDGLLLPWKTEGVRGTVWVLG